jgi:hypothetical protein
MLGGTCLKVDRGVKELEEHVSNFWMVRDGHLTQCAIEKVFRKNTSRFVDTCYRWIYLLYDNTDPTRAFGWSLGEGARRQKGGIKRFEGWGVGRYGCDGKGFFIDASCR